MRNSDARSRKNIVETYTKERIEFIFYLRFYKRSNLTQYLTQFSKNNGQLTIQQKLRSTFHQQNYGHCFDKSDL